MRWGLLVAVLFISCRFSPKIPKEKPVPERPVGYDILVLVEGGEERGRLEAITQDEVVFRTEDGRLRRFPRSKVHKVRFQKLRKGYKAKTVGQLKDKLLESVLADAGGVKVAPTTHSLVLYQETRIAVGDVIEVVQRSISLALTERGCYRVGRVMRAYLPPVQSMEILWARTIKRDSQKPPSQWRVLHLDDEYVEDGAAFAFLPAYNRLRRRKFALRSLQPGDFADIAVKFTYRTTDYLHPFAIRIPLLTHTKALQRRVEVVVPTKANYAVRLIMPQPTENIIRESEVTPKKRAIRFVVKDTEPIAEEERQVSLWSLAPWVAVIRSDGNWHDIAAKFFGYMRKKAAEGDVAPLARSLKGEPVSAVYRFLSCEKGLAGVDFRTYGCDLHDAGWCLKQARLSLPDKAVLAGALLSTLGVRWRGVLLRSRDRGPLPNGAPSLGLFDTLALQVEKDGKWLWFVPEDAETPLCESPPARFIGGWMLAEGEHQPRRITADNPQWHGITRSVTAQLKENGDIEADVTVTYRGDAQIFWRSKMDLPKEELRNEVARLALGDDPRAQLLSFSFEGLRDPTATLVLHYRSRIPSYAQKLGEKGFAMRVPFVRHGGWLAATRKTPLRFATPRTDTTTVTLQLPEGVTADYLPPPIDAVGAGVTYYFRVKQNGTKVVIQEKTTRGVIVLFPADYGAYKGVVAATVRASRQWLILKKEAKK